MDDIERDVLDSLSKKLIDLKKKITGRTTIDSIRQDIEILLCFIENNRKLMKADHDLKIPHWKPEVKMESRMPNQKEFDRLLKVSGKDFEEEVEKSYEDGRITAYEVKRLLEEKGK